MSLLHSTTTTNAKKTGSSKLLFAILLVGVMGIICIAYPVIQNTISIPKVFLLYAVVLLGIFVWLIQSVISKTVRVRRTSLDIPILISAGIFFISSLFSVIPQVSFLGKMNTFVLHTGVYVALVLWAWLCIQAVSTMQRWRTLLQAFLLIGVLQAIVFLIHSFFPIDFLARLSGTGSVFSNSSTLFSVYLAIIAILSIGQLLPKQRHWAVTMFPLIGSIVSIGALLRIGFTSGLVILAVGLALLIVIGTSYLSEVRSSVVIASFSLFVISVLLLIFGLPRFLVLESLPVEVSMGAPSSWQVVKNELLSGADSFLIGSGPGTFLQTFSEHRDAAFNLNQIAWTVRFNTPYNTFFAILSEVGVLGFISFVTLLVGGLGITLSAWNKTRPEGHNGTVPVSTAADITRVETFIVVAAWIALSVGLCTTYFNIATWFVWWTLFALSFSGIASFLPQIIRERRWSLQVSPQYSLVLSFILVVVATGIIVIGAFGSRMFLADVAYAKALRSTTVEDTAKYLTQTLRLRPNYVPYNLSRARLALQRARREAQQPEPNADAVANYLAVAVNTAREATDQQGNDVETWETLASMYLNTQSLVPDANQWAIQSLERALELEPTNPIFHWQMGNARAFSGNLEQAEESYKQAIRLKPDYLVAYVSLSALLESQERYDQAIAVYQPIFRLVEENPEALFTLGRLFYNRQAEGDLERGETVLARAVELAPNYANARFTLGLVYEARGQRQAALEQYEAVAALNPDIDVVQSKLKSLNIPVTPPSEASESIPEEE